LKRNKLFRLISTVFTLALIGASLPMGQVSAAVPVVTLNPAFGKIGTQVAVSGEHFSNNEQYDLYVSNLNLNLEANIPETASFEYFSVVNTGNTGAFSGKLIDIPGILTDGETERLVNPYESLYVYVTIENNDRFIVKGKAEFRVTGDIDVTLTPTQGNVGQELTIEGEGFWPGENLQILFAGIDITQDYIDDEPKAASSGAAAGTFNVVVPVPVTSQGEKEVKVIGKNSGVEVTRTFTVRPKITLSPSEGGADTQIIVRGTGFAQNADIYFGNAFIVRAQATSGTFMEAITIPAGTAPGTYVIKAEDGVRPTTINASASFEVKVYLDPSIELDPQGETVGSIIDISGAEFENSKSITLTINDQPITPDSSITSTSTGTFSGSFVIPELPAGTYTLKASSSTNITATATFTVTHKASLNDDEGKAGDQVVVTGTGFKANTNVSVTFDGTAVNPDGAKTDANGSFSFSITVPVVAEGTHNVAISVGTASVTKAFTTDMNMTITPESGKVGTEVNVTASGFAPSSNADIYFGATKVKTATTTAEGGLNTTITVPAVAEGTYPVKVEVSGISTIKDFTLSAEANFTPASGNVGDDVSIIGTGFGSSKPLTVTWDGDNIGGSSLTTTAEGTFNITFKVPAVKGGSYTISVSDGTVTKTQTFEVDQNTPPVPQPVSPALFSKLNGDVTFDWNPVSYEIMAVTYELQLARDASFTSPVLSKTGLTADQYALTEAEKLEKAGEDNPYFWRVRAVDEAGNASAWTSAAEFYYGSGWPAWLTWVLIGLGVVVLGILAFWVGRRIAYYSY
jgi:phosphoribosylformylglycinamidine (FGAM) synthase PurS component